jgi:hypothetical protein
MGCKLSVDSNSIDLILVTAIHCYVCIVWTLEEICDILNIVSIETHDFGRE